MKRRDDPRHLEVAGGNVPPGAVGSSELRLDPRGEPWLPEGHPAIADTPRAALRYVVVDDLYDEAILLISYLWPSVSNAGTLIFGGDSRLSDLDSWSDTAPGMPIVFTDVSRSGTDVAWMPRQSVQGAIDTARFEAASAEAAHGQDDFLSAELGRPLRTGDTFAMVIRDENQVEVVANADDPPIEVAALDAIDLIDVSRQSRATAKAALVSAVVPPQQAQTLDEEIEASNGRAGRWELEGLTEVVIDSLDGDDLDQDPRDAQPTV